jgi:hypothetical protein
VAAEDGSALGRYAPIFVLQRYGHTYDRIGAAAARLGQDGKEEAFVDPGRPVIYVQQDRFGTDRGSYTNLVYRVHFEGVPFPHLGGGRNAGLLAIVTLDAQERPVLVTTVQANGHYAAVIPTNFLLRDARPPGWDADEQAVATEHLPGLLRCPEPFDPAWRPVIVLRSATHRVMDVRLENSAEAKWRYDVIAAELQPAQALDSLRLEQFASKRGKSRRPAPLPQDVQTTSFFCTSGTQRGLVKGSARPLEVLLRCWWTFDIHVGRDRRYAAAERTGQGLYTSLKFWAREQSALVPFDGFLRYRGWRL